MCNKLGVNLGCVAFCDFSLTRQHQESLRLETCVVMFRKVQLFEFSNMLLNLKILAAFEVLHETKGEADRCGE